jgi:hypothetical protein
MAKRLTRKQIAEGLEAVPLDVVLLGAAGATEQRLTPKQREFARHIALGESKAGAYRAAYKSKGKPRSQSQEGQRLAARPSIARQIDAFKVAIEAQKYATPAHLRALVIERLTAAAIDESIAPAQRLRALELLGKVTEVAAFTERREVVHVQDAGQIRERLINSLRLALAASGAIDATPVPAAEAGQGDPPPAHPLDSAAAQTPPLLSIPHTQSNKNYALTASTTDIDMDPVTSTITPVIVENSNEINDLDPKSALTSPEEVTTNASFVVGGVGAKVSGGFENSSPANPPVNDLVPSGNWK